MSPCISSGGFVFNIQALQVYVELDRSLRFAVLGFPTLPLTWGRQDRLDKKLQQLFS